MYNINAISITIIGIVEILFGLRLSSFLILIGVLSTIFGIYEWSNDKPKVLDKTKYKRRFMTDNSMAYITLNKDVTKRKEYYYVYLIEISLSIFGACFCISVLVKIINFLLAVCYAILLMAYFLRSDCDIYWMPGEYKPVRIFHNESKFIDSN